MIHKLFASTSGDQASTFICPEDCKILAVRWVVSGVTAADGSFFRGELSFAAASQFTINDVVNVIDMGELALELTTSGGAMLNLNDYHELASPVQVDAGEKLYMHTLWASVTNMRTSLFMYTDARITNKSSRMRRGA